MFNVGQIIYKETLDTLDTYVLYIRHTYDKHCTSSNGGHHGDSGAKNNNRWDSQSISSLFSVGFVNLPEMRRSHGERSLHRPLEQQQGA